MDFILVVASLVFVVLAVVWIKQLLGARSSLPLPPSPKGLPVLGNLLDLAGDDVHVKCRDWSRQFGILLSWKLFSALTCVSFSTTGEDIISLNVLGSTMVVLNSAKAVSDIFEKRGSNHSDRPDMPMIVDLYAITYSFTPLSASHIYIEWVGTGLLRSCATVPAGRNIAACFTVTSIIAWRNIKWSNSRYQGSFSLCC